MEALACAGRRDHRGGRARGLQLKQLKYEQRPAELPGFLGRGELLSPSRTLSISLRLRLWVLNPFRDS